MLDNQCIFFPKSYKSKKKIASAGRSFVILIIIPPAKKSSGKNNYMPCFYISFIKLRTQL